MLYNPQHDYKQKDEVACALDRAADLLERSNWVQDMFEQNYPFRLRRTGYCMMGAIHKVITGDSGTGDGEGGLSNQCVMRLRAHMSWDDPSWWNDKEGRTKAEVISMLREVANQGDPDAV